MLDGFLAGLISYNILGSWQDIFLGSILVMSWIVLALVLRMLWVTKVKVAGIDHRCCELSHDLQIAGNAAIGMGQRIIQLEKRLQQSGVPFPHVSVVPTTAHAQVHTNRSVSTSSAADRVVPIQPQSQLSPQSKAQLKTNSEPTAAQADQIKPAEQETLKQHIAAAAELKAIQEGVAQSTDAFYQTNAQQKVKPQSKPQSQQNSQVQSKVDKTEAVLQTSQVSASQAGPSSADQVDSVVSPFDQAKKLLSKGMSELDVAKRCGLSKAEAALLAMVQRQSDSSRNAAAS